MSRLIIIIILLFPSCIDKTTYPINELNVLPEYPQGLDAFYKYLKNGLILSDNLEPVELVFRLEVDLEGNVRNPRIIKGNFPFYEEQIVKKLIDSEKWIPGRINKKNVNTYLDLPFLFLPDKNPEI